MKDSSQMRRVVANAKLLEYDLGNPITGPKIGWVAPRHRPTDQNPFQLAFLFTGHS